MSEREPTEFTRRSFALGLGGAAAVLGLGGAVKAVGAEPICRPPGGQDEDSFIGACIRCEKCREVCPNNVIVPARLEQGFINTRTPTFNFKQGWCDYCAEAFVGLPQCVDVCPTAALKLPVGATPQSVILGKGYIVREWCLSWQLRGCRKCHDACPYEAIEIDGFDRPRVIFDRCNGCGKCEQVCISMAASSISAGATDRAITVKPTLTVEKLLLENQKGGQ